jgi:4-hydroxyphenylpyruvate dioxygenase-like putative hemolysin
MGTDGFEPVEYAAPDPAVLGPIFFGIIHGKGDPGVGTDDFRALFECIGLDPIRRGMLSDPGTTA